MKNPSPLNRWLTAQVEDAVRLRRNGGSAMFPIAALIAYLTYRLSYTAIWLFTEELPAWQNTTLALLVVAGQFVIYHLLIGQSIEPTYDYPEGSDGGRFAAWLWILPFPAPRLLALGLEFKAQARRMSQLDIAACARAISMVMKAQNRVLIDDVAAKNPSIDPDRLVRWLSDIDGVVIVRRGGVGLTLTPGFSQQFEHWLEQDAQDTSPDDDNVL